MSVARDAILDARLLIGHAPLDPHAARDVAAQLLAAGTAGAACAASAAPRDTGE
jgi:hypothetical protein